VITVVGSLNMDLFVEAPRFPCPGETVQGRRFRRSAGGKGANQAVAAARMGGVVRMIGAVGDDSFGQELSRELAGAGVDIAGLRVDSEAPTGTAIIVLDPSGQNQIVVAPGANALLSAEDVLKQKQVFAGSRSVVAQLETSIEAVRAALQCARGAGSLTVLNPAPFCPLDDSLLELADWIIPNELEASGLTGIRVSDVESARAAAALLRSRSPRSAVAITLGAQGVWWEAGERTGHVPGFPVQAVDTVGAGDTFIGAFVSGLTRGWTVDGAVRFACAAAAVAVTCPGAQAGIPTRAEVERFLQSQPVQSFTNPGV
jgi:ribokinase